MSIPSWAVKGAKVVCIRDEWTAHGRTGPTKGELCEVIAVEVERGACWLSLDGHSEWVAVSATRQTRASFDAVCFRPVVPVKTEAHDVALFRHHLHQRVPEKA